MLNKLSIQNFQAHAKLDLDLDERVTTIVGPSDRGKSAVLRALRWVCTNKPGGDSFVREGARGCKVGVILDGGIVSRKRTPSLNEYSFAADGEKVGDYKSFGADVPEPIANFLNLGPVNFQGQHDSPFWLSETAGQVSRNLNEIVNLEIIDQALSSIVRTVTKAKAKAEVVGEQVEQLKKKKRSLVWVKKAKADLKLVAGRQQETAEKGAEAASLGRLCDEGIRNRQMEDRIRGAVSAFSGVLEKGKICRALGEEVSLLEGMIERGRRFEEVSAPDTSKLEEAAGRYNEVREGSLKLRRRMADAREAEEELQYRQEGAKEAQQKLEEEMEGICPLCGAEMGD